MKIIIDSNVYISALGFDNIILDFLNACYLTNFVSIYISDKIYEEIEEVLYQEKFDSKVKNRLDLNAKEEFLENLLLVSIKINPGIKLSVCRDPKDNKFLELAKEIQADYLITGDKDLLELKKFEGTQILKPSEFLKKLR